MSDVLNDFYKINTLEVVDTIATAIITVNKDHTIFKGHFPGNPVMPGVCMMQIIKDITEKVVDKKLFMQSAGNVKFMAIINPNNTPELELEMAITEVEGGGYKVKNISKFGDTIALKLTTNFIAK
ncbi:3-hydroxyacyl-ACP dehydratase [Dokdonia sp.]|uniref:3-hydroxyacyl-ACP dehydratase n=1 Tax=Dokdonia sp. TaxID=2024995 RepID=UPI003266518A